MTTPCGPDNGDAASWGAYPPPLQQPPSGWPGPGYSHWSPPPPPPPRNNLRWWLIGLAIGIAVVLVVVVAVLHGNNSGTPTARVVPPSASVTSTAAAPVDAAALPQLLASAEEAGQIGGLTAMTTGVVNKTPAQFVSARPTNCTGVVVPGAKTTYEGSGYVGFAGDVLDESAPDKHQVMQAVVGFADELTAQKLYSQQVAAWKDCQSTEVEIIYARHKDVDHLEIGSVAESNSMATIVNTPSPGSPRNTDMQCERALSARRNVIVDVRYCEPGALGAAYRLARGIVRRIDGWR